QNLVAYYPFNGNANDESGNNHSGTVKEAVLTTDKNGTANKAYKFDGINDMITTPAHADWSFGNGDFSIISWVNVSVIGTSRIISAGYTANDGIWGLGFGSHPVWGAGIRINYFVYSGGAYHDYSSNKITGYSLGQWAFVGITKTGSTLTFYFNGQQAGTATIPYVSNANSYLSIGSRQVTSGSHIEFFNGKIDAARIFKRALLPDEILQLADVPMMPDLLIYLPMNGNASDMSGNGHSGTVVKAMPTTDKYNNTNSAFQFNGNGSGTSITLANTKTLDFLSTPFTISGWVKFSSAIGEPKMIAGKHICGTPSGYFIGVENNKFSYWLAKGSSWSQVTTTEKYNDGKWHHIVGSYDGVNQKLYVDGMFKAGTSTTYNKPASGAPIKVGEPSGGCGGLGLFNGKVDELKIYGTALNAAQVMALYK
ncbi:MAG: LamG domain-containing protein, partial [Chitinophagaceae bacterium]